MRHAAGPNAESHFLKGPKIAQRINLHKIFSYTNGDLLPKSNGSWTSKALNGSTFATEDIYIHKIDEG